MRGKFLSILPMILCAVLLSSCTRIISGAQDEIRMFSWHSAAESGREVALTFDDDTASLICSGTDAAFTLDGQCFLTDDRLIICDEESGQNYTFGYVLHGDRVELSYNGSVITLDKLSCD